MAENGQRLGELLLEADVITKRQLAKACQKQVKGDRRKLGEILIELNYITVEDLTDVMLNTHHVDTVEPVIEEKVVAQQKPIDISEDAVMKTKFALDVKTLIAAAVGISSLVGICYRLIYKKQKNYLKLVTYILKNIHQDQKVITGQGRMNNIKIKWAIFKKIWMRYLIS